MSARIVWTKTKVEAMRDAIVEGVNALNIETFRQNADYAVGFADALNAVLGVAPIPLRIRDIVPHAVDLVVGNRVKGDQPELFDKDVIQISLTGTTENVG